jgi:5-formyltetrahydrofolate cyclo-ligase
MAASSLSKQQWRVALREKRAAYVGDRVFQQELQPAPRALLLAEIMAAGAIAFYPAFVPEPDLGWLVEVAVAAGKRTALPRIEPDDSMVFAAWKQGEPLLKGQFVNQPLRHAAAIVPDVLLMPLVGFDRQGNRLGQGKGYYDKACVHLPHARKIGIAWSVQEVPALPHEPHDVPLHAICTEKEWIVYD